MLLLIHIFFLECHPVKVISNDLTHFVNNPLRRILKFIIVLKQDWF